MANQQKVAVIGAGVMGEALIAALIRAGVAPASIAIVEKRLERATAVSYTHLTLPTKRIV